MSRQRLTYLDTAAGILLIYMVVYHCAQWAGLGVAFIERTLWLGFFMPWFFFKSGMFYRHEPAAVQAGKAAKRLLVPFIVFGVAGTLVFWVCRYAEDGSLGMSQLMAPARSLLLRGTWSGNMPLWFLSSLFAVRLLYNVLEPWKYGAAVIAALVCAVFALHYILQYIDDPALTKYTPSYFQNIPMGLMYYALGHRLRDVRLTKPVMAALVCLYLVAMAVNPTYVYMYDDMLLCGTYLLAPVYSVVGIMTLNSLCRHFGNRRNFLSGVGADTMPFYCMHWIVITAASLMFMHSTQPDMQMFVCLIGANIVLLPLLTYMIRKANLNFIFG